MVPCTVEGARLGPNVPSATAVYSAAASIFFYLSITIVRAASRFTVSSLTSDTRTAFYYRTKSNFLESRLWVLKKTLQLSCESLLPKLHNTQSQFSCKHYSLFRTRDVKFLIAKLTSAYFPQAFRVSTLCPPPPSQPRQRQRVYTLYSCRLRRRQWPKIVAARQGMDIVSRGLSRHRCQA